MDEYTPDATLTVTIKNWDEYQGESKRYDTATWFRMQNSVWMNELWDVLDDAEFKVFIFMLSYTSQKFHKTGRAEINVKTISRMANFKENVLLNALAKLSKLKILSINTRCPHGDVTVHAQALHRSNTDESREVHALQNITEQKNILRIPKKTGEPKPPVSDKLLLDFESAYALYPRKLGKARGMKACAAQIKTEDGLSELKAAVLRYKTHCETEGLEPKFIKHFSSFMSEWRDWLDPLHGSSDIVEKSKLEWDWVSEVKTNGKDGEEK